MTPRLSPFVRFLGLAPLWVGCGATLSGCGGGGGDLGSEFGQLREERSQGSELAVLADADLRNVPLVFLDRLRGGSALQYRIQGQEYQERELLGLCRTMADNDAKAAVCLVPSGALTADEVSLVEAKLRETGIWQVRVLQGASGLRK